jgi:cell division protein FtsB
MSTIAESARLARPRPRLARRERATPRLLGGGVLWIVIFAVLLSGVVAVNVAVLRLNLQLDGVTSDDTQLKADIADLRSHLSNKVATYQIERRAKNELGLVQADPSQTTFVQLPAR